MILLQRIDPDPDTCDGPKGWAYVTALVDGPGVHYGLLGIADDLVVSALDDRFFVASSASLSQDPPSAPAAWLIDSVTGQRGPLTWQDEPTTLNSAEQVLMLFPAHSIPWDTDSGQRFLPRVVDRRDWTIRPLSVPDDASAALRIHQPGVGRIWIGTAPDGGEVGLAYYRRRRSVLDQRRSFPSSFAPQARSWRVSSQERTSCWLSQPAGTTSP